MMQNRSSIASHLCLWAFAATLGACATGQDLRETSKKFEGQTETVRTSLEAKIEQLKQTQRDAEKSLAKIEQLIEDNKREQTQTRELAAKLNSDLRSFREMDLTKVEGRIERAKKDIEALQGRVEDQVNSLRQNAQQWLAILDEKQTAKLDQQVARVDQQVAKVEAREARIQETLTTLGKKIDERIKKVEDDGRATTNNLTAHLTEVDKSLAQVSETVRTVGTKLSTQLEQQGGSLARLEEANKQADGQIRTLTPRVDQLKTSLGDLAKVLHTLTEKSAEIDRRVADVAGGSEQGAKMEARIEVLTKSLNATMTSVNDTTRAVGELKQVLDVSVGKLASRVDEQGDALNKLAQQLPGPRTASIAPSEPDQPDVASNVAARPNIEASVSPETAYEHAYQEFQQNQFENALVSFRNFLSQYPTSNLVPNAHFWIAECYVKKRDYQKSLSAYEEVIRHHPKSGKASIALYRKALVLLELKDKMAAKTALKKLIADYPRSEESKQARTKLASLQ
jgi:tol-pal system protein YbgF